MTIECAENADSKITIAKKTAPRSHGETYCYVPRELLEELLDYVSDYANEQSCLKTFNADRRLLNAKKDIIKVRKILDT